MSNDAVLGLYVYVCTCPIGALSFNYVQEVSNSSKFSGNAECNPLAHVRYPFGRFWSTTHSYGIEAKTSNQVNETIGLENARSVGGLKEARKSHKLTLQYVRRVLETSFMLMLPNRRGWFSAAEVRSQVAMV
jgi:hypothetical protein